MRPSSQWKWEAPWETMHRGQAARRHGLGGGRGRSGRRRRTPGSGGGADPAALEDAGCRGERGSGWHPSSWCGHARERESQRRGAAGASGVKWGMSSLDTIVPPSPVDCPGSPAPPLGRISPRGRCRQGGQVPAPPSRAWVSPGCRRLLGHQLPSLPSWRGGSPHTGLGNPLGDERVPSCD